ncbi:MAG: glycosyltransferase family 2 protein [Pseudomonadota bacterium]
MSSVAVVILTYNEEPNLKQALDSVSGWAKELFIFDSFSTDKTLDIAGRYGCTVMQHEFIDYAKQRNAALQRLPIKSEWVFFLDADEWLPEDLKREITAVIAERPAENGFLIKRRFIWMGRWIRRGYYPVWILRLFRVGKARCEDREVNEAMIVEGKVGHLRNDFVHEDRRGIADWISKHNSYATREARCLLHETSESRYREIDARLFGTQDQRKRWVRHKIWDRMPLVARPFFKFFFRYVLRGGFLDGKEAFIYHFMQGLWFALLIDCKYIEMKANIKYQGYPKRPPR